MSRSPAARRAPPRSGKSPNRSPRSSAAAVLQVTDLDAAVPALHAWELRASGRQGGTGALEATTATTGSSTAAGIAKLLLARVINSCEFLLT